LLYTKILEGLQQKLEGLEPLSPIATAATEGNRIGAGNAGTDGFTTVKRKRGSHRSKDASNCSKSSKSSNSSYMEPKKKCTESAVNQDQDRAPGPSSQTSAQVNLNVYVKGVDFDIAKHVVKHPIAFKRSLCRVFGDVSEVKLLNGCLRVTCKNERQRQLLLAATDLDGKTVEVTEPFGRASGSGPCTRSARVLGRRYNPRCFLRVNR